MKPDQSKTSDGDKQKGIGRLGAAPWLGQQLMAQSENGDADKALCLLLGTELQNRQGDTSSLSLAKELRMQADCPDCFAMGLKAHIYLISQKYQKMLARWKALGCPDPGGWPDLHTDLFLVSYLRMASACCPNDSSSPIRAGRGGGAERKR